MNRKLLLFPLLSVFTLSGCATWFQGEDEQRTAVESFENTQKQMTDVRAQVARTMHSLDTLMSAPPSEIRSAFGPYERNVERLSAMTGQLSENAREMRQQRINYMAEWDRTRLNVEDPQLRRVADQRRQQVGQQLLQIEQQFQRTDQTVDPLVNYLQDIRRVVGRDPTAANIAAVQQSGVVQKAKQEASRLNNRLTVAINEFDQVLGRLSPEPGVPAAAATRRPAAGGTAAAAPSFTQADRDQSGAIEQGEASAIQGLDFQSADRDGDGRLSQSEYEAAMKQRSGQQRSGQGATPGSASPPN